jgi:hypothetical protein
MVRAAADGGIKTTITARRLDGTRMKISYTAKYDGAASSIAGTGTQTIQFPQNNWTQIHSPLNARSQAGNTTSLLDSSFQKIERP